MCGPDYPYCVLCCTVLHCAAAIMVIDMGVFEIQVSGTGVEFNDISQVGHRGAQGLCTACMRACMRLFCKHARTS